MQIGNYILHEQLAESEKSKVFLATLNNEPAKYVIKSSFGKEQNSSKELAIRNEYEIAKMFLENEPGCDVFKYEGQLVFVRKYVDGTTLNKWVETNKPALNDKIKIFRLIAEQLAALHSKKLIHKDLSAANIIVDDTSDPYKVTLIDYDLSARLDQKSYHVNSTQALEGTLPYMAPEQTGRMNRSVDYRADLYAMGVIMYELLSDKLPFASDDALEIIHGHLSKMPPSLNVFVPELPQMMDTIVQKLLSKNAEDRYQSALSLASDLAKCEEELLNSGNIRAFIVAEVDRPLYFQIPEKLYGRAGESKTLLEAFEATSSGKKLLLTIAGYSGVGKSRLVHDIHTPITLKNGFFISGKFDLLQRNTPYLAWIQALQKFAEIILTQNRSVIDYWKEKILTAMGQSAGVITALVPALESILGKLELREDISVNEDSNRFNYALRQFIKSISTKEHPLVVFLDDMQWADNASLNLLKVIMTEPGLGHLLIIASYRDNEVDENHPFIVSLENVQKEWQKVNEMDTSAAYAPNNELIIPVTLQNLSLNDLLDMVKDTFKCDDKSALKLAQIVYDKTKGNSFFTHKFIETLYENGLVNLVQTQKKLEWEFDFERIPELTVTDNVLDLMNRQIEKLPAETIQLLKLASCLGYQFELNDLAAIAKTPAKQTEVALFAALDTNYILPTDSNYKYVESFEHGENQKIWFKFSHDRIAQTFYSSLSSEDKKAAHASAFYLFQPLIESSDTSSERIFEQAGHLANAAELINDPGLYKKINFLAGVKAKSSSAFSLAYTYFKNVVDVSVDQTIWQSDYDQHFKLYIETAECAYQTGLYEETENLTQTVLKNVKSNADYARAIEVLLDAYFLQQRFQDGVDIGLETLKKLGLKLPKKAGKFDVVSSFLLTNIKTNKFKPEELGQLHHMSDKELIPIVRIMPLIAPSAFFANTNLFVLLALKMTGFTLKNGISTYATQAVANFSFMLCAILGNYKRGILFSDNLLKLLEGKEFSRYRIRTKFIVYFFVEHYKTNIYNSVALLKEAFKEGLESGDSDFTAFIGNGYMQNSILVGADLNEVSIELRRQAQYNLQVKNHTAKTFTDIYFQFVSCLMGEVPVDEELNGKHFDKDKDLKQVLAINNGGALVNIYIYQANLYLFFGKYREALAEITKAHEYKDIVMGVAQGNTLPYIDALCRFMLAIDNPKENRQALVKGIDADKKKIAKLALQCKDDFVHKLEIINAIQSALKGDNTAALKGFEKAVKLINVNINRLDKAVCLLIYARYCESISMNDLAYLKMRESAKLFADFGATAVSDHLENHCKQWMNQVTDFDIRPSMPSSSVSLTHQGIDMFSVLKSTQVISSEYELGHLIKKLLPLIIENAGAERGVLILADNEQLFVKAATDAEGQVKEYEQMPVEYFPVSSSIVNYVANTLNPVILDHAHLSGRFVNDEYIVKNKVRSLLCMVIKHQNKLSGLLYLENNLVSGAFTQGRIDVLNILTTQAAISIENATYFKHINELNTAYERFVPQSFLGQLEKTSILNINIGDQVSKTMTVMFADIRNFTGISETLNSAEVFTLLNEVWGMLTPVIEKHKGIIDKYIGDSIMALFPAASSGALEAAIEMQNLLERFNSLRNKKKLFQVNMGVGINTGNLILGTVGSNTRLNTTVIGDTVNVAARLESLSKHVSAKILVTSNTTENLRFTHHFHLRNMGKITLKGKQQDISIFEEYSNYSKDLRDSIQQNKELFDSMVQAVDEGKKEEGLALLNEYLRKVPEDSVITYYREVLS